jgi:hypothetical protein
MLEITFNKLLIRDFTLADLNHVILQEDYISTISISLHTIEERQRYEISYQASFPIDTTISISLKVSNVIQDRQLQNLTIKDYNVSVPILLTAEPITPNKKEFEESDGCEDAYIVEYATNLTLIISYSILLIVCILNRNLNPAWSMLNSVQIIRFSTLLNINIPCKIRTIAKGMSFRFLPNIFGLFIKYESDSSPKRYEEMGYDNTIYLINNGDLLTILVINTVFYLLLKFTHHILRRRDSKLLRTISMITAGYEWSFFLRFLIQGYLDIAVSSSFTLKYLPHDIEIPDYITAALSFVKFT